MKEAYPEYGVLAEFETARDLFHAVHEARNAGYQELEAYSPFPIEGLSEAIGLKPNRIPLITLIFGIAGGLAAYYLQWYSAVTDYPFNIGGRPHHSWPTFIIITIEFSILCAALAAFFSMLIMNGLPQLRHPVFNARAFQAATSNRFFLCIKSTDASFVADNVKIFLLSLKPLSVTEISMD